MPSPSEIRQSPYRDPRTRPTWAQLIRLTGDRCAILFRELRMAMGRIDGVVEELHFTGPEDGWGVRYRLGEGTLLVAFFAPLRLEATVNIGAELCQRLLAARRVSGRLKEMLRSAPRADGVTPVRNTLRDRTAVRSMSLLAFEKSRSFPQRQP